jgi:hypothetical protein
MDRELERRLVRQWVETGKLLDEIRRRELRELTPERRLQIIDDVLSIPLPTPTPEHRRRTSGLVAQQELFRKLHRR